MRYEWYVYDSICVNIIFDLKRNLRTLNCAPLLRKLRGPYYAFDGTSLSPSRPRTTDRNVFAIAKEILRLSTFSKKRNNDLISDRKIKVWNVTGE